MSPKHRDNFFSTELLELCRINCLQPPIEKIFIYSLLNRHEQDHSLPEHVQLYYSLHFSLQIIHKTFLKEILRKSNTNQIEFGLQSWHLKKNYVQQRMKQQTHPTLVVNLFKIIWLSSIIFVIDV
ncbi:hypothetical protein BpHYR1_051904 [Brachionus plicatilis]|uniref:Uncharacterized protein n=1 Tax=Brachionus plicatilis TaxID=10195 RepID=A0A3M7RME3_BRAPC|nr:hypothetical protein BpHYR1_051904 [Brachionus plicatilis]